MKIAVMGSGGVGAYYGGLLAHHGLDVTFIARGSHLEAIRKNGLQIQSMHGNFTIQPAQVTDVPAEIGLVDYILFCVKTINTDQAAQAIQPIVGPQTTVVSLQNGIDAAERIGSYVGGEHVLGGTTWISSVIDEPGVIQQVSQFRRIVLGEFNGQDSPRLQRIAHALAQTGITLETTLDIRKVLWTKFVFIASVSGIGALTGLEIGDYRFVPETRSVLRQFMHEIEAVGRAKGIHLDENVVEQTLDFVDKSASHIRTSMQRDIEAGRPSELESMIGVIGREGRQNGVLTPVADIIYALLLPAEQKNGIPPDK